jgi:hypothetical protein
MLPPSNLIVCLCTKHTHQTALDAARAAAACAREKLMAAEVARSQLRQRRRERIGQERGGAGEPSETATGTTAGQAAEAAAWPGGSAAGGGGGHEGLQMSDTGGCEMEDADAARGGRAARAASGAGRPGKRHQRRRRRGAVLSKSSADDSDGNGGDTSNSGSHDRNCAVEGASRQQRRPPRPAGVELGALAGARPLRRCMRRPQHGEESGSDEFKRGSRGGRRRARARGGWRADDCAAEAGLVRCLELLDAEDAALAEELAAVGLSTRFAWGRGWGRSS